MNWTKSRFTIYMQGYIHMYITLYLYIHYIRVECMYKNRLMYITYITLFLYIHTFVHADETHSCPRDRQHQGLIEGRPETPRTITALSYQGDYWGTLIGPSLCRETPASRIVDVILCSPVRCAEQRTSVHFPTHREIFSKSY